MRKLLSCILVLAVIVTLFSVLTYAAELPTGSEEPGRPPVSGADADSPEFEGSAEPEESEEPEDPHAFREDLFTDVGTRDWFFDSVKTVYELGLMQGRKADVFAPSGSISLAEVITVAVRLRSAFLGDGYDFSGGKSWYAPAVEYAVAQGIIQKGDFSSYTAKATRAQVAYILSGALPSGALEEMNTVEDNSLPDVKMNDRYAANIYFLYRTGILSGKDGNGTFSPSGYTTRAETAAIVSRLADASLRVTCEFRVPAPTYPDLPLRERADDSFFSDTAILGNSLVDGLRLYAKLKTVDYYCATSMSVVSALKTKNVLLQDGTYGTQMDAIAQKQYGKIYIELGINEMGGNVNTFIKNYRTMLDRIRAAQPNAEIYIMAVTPTSQAKTGTSFSRERVLMYNEALYNLANQWGCWYLDDFTPLADGDGYLPASETWDGVHFVAAKYKSWEELIRTHYA